MKEKQSGSWKEMCSFLFILGICWSMSFYADRKNLAVKEPEGAGERRHHPLAGSMGWERGKVASSTYVLLALRKVPFTVTV